MGKADSAVKLPEHELTLIFKPKFETSADPQKLDKQLAAATAQLKVRDHGNNVHAQKIPARFALGFCADKAERRVVRWQLVDKIPCFIGLSLKGCSKQGAAIHTKFLKQSSCMQDWFGRCCADRHGLSRVCA